MAWRFRKKIRIIPGIHLNLSKSGISTSIGVRGASVTLGKSGTYLNAGIPGTGIYSTQKLTVLNTHNESPGEEGNSILEESVDNIFSVDLQEITSQGMQGVKESIILANDQRRDLRKDLSEVKQSLFISECKHFLVRFLIIGLLNKSISKSMKDDIDAQKKAIIQIEEAIDNSYIKLEVDFDTEIKSKYEQVIKTFEKLITSEKIWDITSEHSQDRAKTRSSASSVVNKREVKFATKSLPFIKSESVPLWFKNANGADLYFYPNFIVMHSSGENFAVIGIEELNFTHSYARFIETGLIPKDTRVVDRTWAKVNKSGSPDRRFKGNYQIPVVKYGTISLNTKTGLNEEYQISNYEYTEAFGRAFQDYQSTIKGLSQNIKKIDTEIRIAIDREEALRMKPKHFGNMCWGMSEYQVKLCLSEEQLKQLYESSRYHKQKFSFSYPEDLLGYEFNCVYVFKPPLKKEEPMRWTSSFSKYRKNDTCINNNLAEIYYELCHRPFSDILYLKIIKAVFQMLSSKYGSEYVVLNGDLGKILSEDAAYSQKICEKPAHKVLIRWDIGQSIISLFFETRRGVRSFLVSYQASEEVTASWNKLEDMSLDMAE